MRFGSQIKISLNGENGPGPKRRTMASPEGAKLYPSLRWGIKRQQEHYQGGLALWGWSYALINRDFLQFLALQAKVHGREHGHTAETQQEAQENTTEENDDNHVVTSPLDLIIGLG